MQLARRANSAVSNDRFRRRAGGRNHTACWTASRYRFRTVNRWPKGKRNRKVDRSQLISPLPHGPSDQARLHSMDGGQGKDVAGPQIAMQQRLRPAEFSQYPRPDRLFALEKTKPRQQPVAQRGLRGGRLDCRWLQRFQTTDGVTDIHGVENSCPDRRHADGILLAQDAG